MHTITAHCGAKVMDVGGHWPEVSSMNHVDSSAELYRDLALHGLLDDLLGGHGDGDVDVLVNEDLALHRVHNGHLADHALGLDLRDFDVLELLNLGDGILAQHSTTANNLQLASAN